MVSDNHLTSSEKGQGSIMDSHHHHQQQPPSPSFHSAMRSLARDRATKRRLKIVGLACLVFIVYAQWTQITSPTPSSGLNKGSSNNKLSITRLQDDLKTCASLRTKPTNPIGAGREKNARYVKGQKATLIKNATVWTGEPAERGTSDEEEARRGKGFKWIEGVDVLLEYGLIKRVGNIDEALVAKETLVYDAQGRMLTSGIIDMHSHAGVDNQPELKGNEDTNEMSSDITPYVRSIDGLDPLDYQLQVVKSGGVTTSLVLPGSGNNIGGEAFVIKHAIGKEGGREELSARDMLAVPVDEMEKRWRYIKMACGENPKRVYGKVGERGPVSRLGESWEFRRAFETAQTLVREQDDWCAAAEEYGIDAMDGYLPQDLKWETLSSVLRGHVHVNTHCYTIPDLEAFVDHTNEFGFAVRAFHHAHQTFLVPEILKRAWGANDTENHGPPASALFADNMFYKAEAYIGSEYAGKSLWENGLTPIYVSDNPVINAQHVVFEAAKAFGYGLPYHVAMASVTTAPAERLGLGNRLGKVKAGFDADVVVWDSDPMSVGATPVQVWIDGKEQFEHPFVLEKPASKPIGPGAEGKEAVKPKQTAEDAVTMQDVVFTGVSKSFLEDSHSASNSNNANDESISVIIKNGKITCLGACTSELKQASQQKIRTINLANGYITKPFTAFGTTIGLNAIDAEDVTDNGGSAETFSRAIDGLKLGTKKLHYALKYGITKAITAPTYTSARTFQGVSVGFRTDAKTSVEKGAVWRDDVSVHYTLDDNSKSGSKSVSNAVGVLRQKLLAAAAGDAKTTEEDKKDPYGEAAYLKKVVKGDVPLVISVHSADGIASVLRLKKTVDEAASGHGINVVILGGAEAHMLANELAEAKIGVVLAPLNSYRSTWDQRRALVGAPLNNGTSVEKLVAAGVVTAIGLEEDWLVRDMGLLAGIAWRNSGGIISEKGALELAGGNVAKMLGLKKEETEEQNGEFVVFEGSPLEVGARVRGVASGHGKVAVFEEV